MKKMLRSPTSRLSRKGRNARSLPCKLNRLATWSSIAANTVTALAGGGAFFLYLWTVHSDYVKERDPQFAGNWTTDSEGCVDCVRDENPFITKLEIDVTNGEITGAIYVDDPFNKDKPKPHKSHKETAQQLIYKLNRSYTNWFMLEGNLTFHRGTIHLFDFRMGQKQYFADADIKLKNGTLYFETIKSVYDTIPLKAVFILDPKR